MNFETYMNVDFGLTFAFFVYGIVFLIRAWND